MHYIKVKEKGKEKRYPIKLGLNVYRLVQKETGRNVDLELSNFAVDELLVLFRYMAIVGCKKEGIYFPYDDEFNFLEMIDENPNCFTEFTEVITEQLEMRTKELTDSLEKMMVSLPNK